MLPQLKPESESAGVRSGQGIIITPARQGNEVAARVIHVMSAADVVKQAQFTLCFTFIPQIYMSRVKVRKAENYQKIVFIFGIDASNRGSSTRAGGSSAYRHHATPTSGCPHPGRHAAGVQV